MLKKIAVGSVSLGGACWASKCAAEREMKQLKDDGLPLTFDAEKIEEYWSQHKLIAGWRMADILQKMIPFGVSYLTASYITASAPSYSSSSAEGVDALAAQQKQWGQDLRFTLIKLGPAFIKLGQMMSIRPDRLPAPVLFELQKLCDSVPPYNTHEALSLLRSELGENFVNLLLDIDEDSIPIAAASLGQVYKARLRGEDERSEVAVAVKVQRPDMLRAVSLDIYLMRQFMHVMESFKKWLVQSGLVNITERKSFHMDLVDSFAIATYAELDYEHEASNQEFFAEKLQVHEAGSGIYVPRVYRQTTTRRVLTTEWIEGPQLKNCSPEVIQELIPRGVECFLKQLLEIGYFHGDPHPGNLLVNNRGQLVLIDFGLCAKVDAPHLSSLTQALVHLMTGDVPGLLEDAIDLGFLPTDVDRTDLLPALTRVFSSGQVAADQYSRNYDNDADTVTARAGDSKTNKVHYKSTQRRQQFHAISNDLNAIFFEFPFIVPEYFALITRALIVLEGIAVIGEPTFDIFAASYPYASKHALKLFGGRDMLTLVSAAATSASRRSGLGSKSISNSKQS